MSDRTRSDAVRLARSKTQKVSNTKKVVVAPPLVFKSNHDHYEVTIGLRSGAVRLARSKTQKFQTQKSCGGPASGINLKLSNTGCPIAHVQSCKLVLLSKSRFKSSHDHYEVTIGLRSGAVRLARSKNSKVSNTKKLWWPCLWYKFQTATH